MTRLIGNISMAVMVLLLLHSTANAFNLPSTGETSCYDVAGKVTPCEGTGQDGEYEVNPMSYTDNSDGTVTDKNTGLMWQKCSVGQNNDSTCSGTASSTFNWYQASGTYDIDYNSSTQNVCGSLTLGSHDDWRLPTKKELRGIVDYSINMPGPMIQMTYFPNTIATYYWSSHTSPDRAGVVVFSNGKDYNWSPSASDKGVYVRCVRGEQATQILTDNGDGTVTDSSTGLMWQQDEPGKKGWNNALVYCNDLVLPLTNGYSGRRLPNIKELEWLMDETLEYDQARTFFPNFPLDGSHFYCTSTTESSGSLVITSGSVWTVSSSYAGVMINGKSASYPLNVRCVRSSLLVRLMRAGTPGDIYSALQAAYDAATDKDIIQAQAMSFAEALTLSRDVAVLIEGGYDSGFTSNQGFTTTHSMTIGGPGEVTVENLIIM